LDEIRKKWENKFKWIGINNSFTIYSTG